MIMKEVPNNSQLQFDHAFKYLIEFEKYTRIGQLADGLAHNLQSPLTAIKGYAQLIQIDHGEIEELGLILKEVELIQSITHNLMSKMRQLQEPSIRPIFLNDVIHLEMEFLNAHLIFKHKIKKHICLDDELPIVEGVYADFSQMILNLLLNSIDAMVNSVHKDLFVETSHDPSFININIRDTGDGVPEKNQTHIVKPFFTNKKQFSDIHDANQPLGAGIGLTVVKTLIEKYGGTLHIQSDKTGTMAALKIPIQK